jgi:hypothetical protein
MEVTSIETLRRMMAEAQMRCESANVPLYQSLYAQATAEGGRSRTGQAATAADTAPSPEAREARGIDALERALAGTLDGVCARVRQFEDEAVRGAFPACATREAQLQTCASWLAAARCEGAQNADFAAAHPQLCAVAARNAMMLR